MTKMLVKGQEKTRSQCCGHQNTTHLGDGSGDSALITGDDDDDIGQEEEEEEGPGDNN